MIYISIVSHRHFNLIKKIGFIEKLKGVNNIQVIIRDNIGEIGFSDWCIKNAFHYIKNDSQYGFGKNNNLNFKAAENLGISDNDYFLVLNPDIDLEVTSLFNLCTQMKVNSSNLGTINLFLDKDCTIFDNSVRNFPSFIDFCTSFLFKKNNTIINKSKLNDVEYVDWAAGSFLMFTCHAYKSLNGFDENYFMYCEDIDICNRYLSFFGHKMTFYKKILGIHYSQRKSRNLFSRHFLWHLKSSFRYLWKF